MFMVVLKKKSYRASLVAQTVKSPPAMQVTRVQFLGQEDPLEKGMATHSSVLVWRIPWTEEPGGLQSMGSKRVGHDWVTSTFPFYLFYIWQCASLHLFLVRLFTVVNYTLHKIYHMNHTCVYSSVAVSNAITLGNIKSLFEPFSSIMPPIMWCYV